MWPGCGSGSQPGREANRRPATLTTTPSGRRPTVPESADYETVAETATRASFCVPKRQGLAAALDYLRPGDTLVVWKLDRLGRSVKEVLTIADDLHARGVGVKILTGKLSGSYSPHGEGKFFFTMMAAFAELERDIIHERTMAGLKAARAQGRVGGRPTVMDPDKLAAARARRALGESPTQIAKALGVSRASVYRHLGDEAQKA